MKAAVYCGTKNVYQDMIPSMKSLLIHSDVDKIYFLIEDDTFPYELPPEVECINVSNQPWFPQDGPNMQARCSYMVLLRAAFTKIFPSLDTILNMDNDTIVIQNISNLWNLDLTNYYIAGVEEPKKTTKSFKYINMGVSLINLKKLREDKKDEELIFNLNNYYYIQAEQDCFNFTCQDKILSISNKYNNNFYTTTIKNITQTKIRHFAYTPNWQSFPLVQKYRNIEIIKRNISDDFGLDIIIPVYNNFDGLNKTLKLIYNPTNINIHITVIDDYSTVNYDELKKKYSKVTFFKLDKNSGPGAARQKGIEITTFPYLLFIDAGDNLVSKVHLTTILNTLKNNNDGYIFSWAWYNEESKTIQKKDNWQLHGTCFNREFLELYAIQFPITSDCSYCGEDLSFMQKSYLMMSSILYKERLSHVYNSKIIIYNREYNPSSIMHTNPHQKIIKGIVNNYKDIIKYCKNQSIPYTCSVHNVCFFMIQLYIDYLKCAKICPELLTYNLNFIKEYYNEVYKPYEKINQLILEQIYSKRMKELIKLRSNAVPNINLYRFIESLKEK